MARPDEPQIIYGRNPVAEARRGRRRVRRVWTPAELSGDELTRLAGSPDHQGLVAEVDPYLYADPDSLLAAADALVVVLDEVQDPRNLGAVCRSAEAAGASGVVVPERRSAAITAAACKASAGAVEHLSVARVRNLADWLGRAKGAGAWIYGARTAGSAAESGAEPASDLTTHTDADLRGRVVLVLGSEGRGLRPRVAGGCDLLLSIPMAGRVASLNVSAAATVLLFEARRQRAGEARPSAPSGP